MRIAAVICSYVAFEGWEYSRVQPPEEEQGSSICLRPGDRETQGDCLAGKHSQSNSAECRDLRSAQRSALPKIGVICFMNWIECLICHDY